MQVETSVTEGRVGGEEMPNFINQADKKMDTINRPVDIKIETLILGLISKIRHMNMRLSQDIFITVRVGFVKNGEMKVRERPQGHGGRFREGSSRLFIKGGQEASLRDGVNIEVGLGLSSAQKD